MSFRSWRSCVRGVARRSFNFIVAVSQVHDPSIDIARKQILQPVWAWRNALFVSVQLIFLIVTIPDVIIKRDPCITRWSNLSLATMTKLRALRIITSYANHIIYSYCTSRKMIGNLITSPSPFILSQFWIRFSFCNINRHEISLALNEFFFHHACLIE